MPSYWRSSRRQAFTGLARAELEQTVKSVHLVHALRLWAEAAPDLVEEGSNEDTMG